MNYNEPLYRPPSEGNSLIFQISYGCPHNTCTFCPMYKNVKYSERPLKNILRDVKEMSAKYPDTKRIFLADGDALYMSFTKLEAIFNALNSSFNRLARISMYANGSSIMDKSVEQLKWLKENKLYTFYLGLESGSDDILRKVRKGETADQMTRAVRVAQECGIRMSVMILIGLGGQSYTLTHAEETAKVINNMQPKFLAALRFINPPGNKVFDNYIAISEYGSIAELRCLIKDLKLRNTIFRANHSSNPIPIAARFPKDHDNLISELDYMLKNENLSKEDSGYISPWL